MHHLTSENGFKIPAIGLGTWTSPVPREEVSNVVKIALDIGYRHIDCALFYNNEDGVGDGISAKLSEGVICREDLFVTSKLWNTFHRPDLVKKSCKQSLEMLKLSYLDLYLMHWPTAFAEDGELVPKDDNGDIIFSDVDYMDTWKAMEELVDEGLVKAIGVSNFNCEQVERILSGCRIAPVCLQAESSPYIVNQRLFDFVRERGLVVVAFSPLGSATRPWAKPEDPQLLEEPLLKTIGAKYGKTPAQVLIRFQLDRGIGVIPKSFNPERMRENFNVFDFSLTQEEIRQISSFNTNFRAVGVTWLSRHKYYPFHEPL